VAQRPRDQAERDAATAQDYDLSEQIGFILRQANQRHVAIFSEVMGSDITPTQWAVLTRLYADGACSQNELGRQAAMDVATVKGVVDRLISRDLIASRPHPEDGRRVILELTEAGRDLTRERLPKALSVSKLTLQPLTLRQRATLLDLLKRLL
jgi:DNA-binding MarR family transcriptional regulator